MKLNYFNKKTEANKQNSQPANETQSKVLIKSQKRKGDIDYGREFFKRNEFKARQNVYISQKNHAIISKITKTIGNKEMSVGGYIDLIITEHFQHYEPEIMEEYRKWKEQQTTNLDDLL